MAGIGPGTRIGNYRIELPLGTTRSGVLFRATHVMLPRRATIKILSPHAREAWVMESLQHGGTPTVYEAGVLDGHRAWFASEPIDGITIAERIAHQPYVVVEAISILRDIAETLEHAHRRSISHRDLRSDRIVLTPERKFPLCVPDWSEACVHTETHDDRVDVYALGLIARELCPRAPRDLARLIDQMLAVDPFERPSTSEIRADLAWLTIALGPSPEETHIEEVVLVDTEGVPALPTTRTRRLRWTPLGIVTSETMASASGEIDDLDLETGIQLALEVGRD